jgi:hypothetical protein
MDIPMLRPLALIVVAACTSGGAETLTVCQVLANPSSFAARPVSVSGLWRWSDSGQSLRASSPCEHATTRKGWQFFDAIDLVPARREEEAEYRAAYRSAKGSGSRDVKVFAAFTGVIESREDFGLWTDGFGKQWPDVFRYCYLVRLRFRSVTQTRSLPYLPGEVEEDLKAGWGNPWPIRLEREPNPKRRLGK